MHTPIVNGDIRTELIEVIVSNVSAVEFSLGQLPNLRNAKRIVRVEAFPVAAVTLSPSGKPLVNATVFQKAFLRLINNRNTDLRQVPLQAISKSINGTTIPEMNCGAIDPEKSKIVVGSSVALVLNEVFLLQVTYEQNPH